MSDESVAVETGTSRRAMFAGAGAVGAAAVLAACGTDQDDPFSGSAAESPATPGNSTPGAVESSAPPAEGEAGLNLIETSEVEVGGGLLVNNDEFVVTQPTEGEWRGFSAICTHQGCTVAEVADGTINCNCHGSRYSIEDGSVVQAARGVEISEQDPLPAINVEVQDGWVVQV